MGVAKTDVPPLAASSLPLFVLVLRHRGSTPFDHELFFESRLTAYCFFLPFLVFFEVKQPQYVQYEVICRQHLLKPSSCDVIVMHNNSVQKHTGCKKEALDQGSARGAFGNLVGPVFT